MAIVPRSTPTAAPSNALENANVGASNGAPAPADPAPTIAPPKAAEEAPQPESAEAAQDAAGGGSDKESPFPKPKLRLEMRELGHEGSQVFLESVNAASVLATAVSNVQRLLYGRDLKHADPTTHITPTRSVTVILHDMGGVAYTTGSELDSDHKEIHVSLSYIANIKPRTERATPEITGVLTHELVHCYQWNALGTCPGGLVEGIADWVRLHCGLEPPHWKREPANAGRWDAGYQHTGYFLDYLEKRYGSGTVRRINEKLRVERYEEKAFWTELLGRPVEQLWTDYIQSVKDEESTPAPTKTA